MTTTALFAESVKPDFQALGASEQKIPGNGSFTKTENITQISRIPNVALGKVLDGGKDAAHAAKLLAIKASKGDGYVLNETCCRLHYGVSRRAFQAGIRRAKSVGTLVRERRGRSFAKEQPINAGAGWYVQFDERLLTQRSALVGFILAVNLARDPVLPSEAAKRIGVTAKGTIRKLVSDAENLGAIEILARSGRSSWVARRGYDFDLVKNEPVKNEPVKNDPTHRGMEEPHSRMKERTQRSEKKNACDSTLSNSQAPLKAHAVDSDFQDEVKSEPSWIILKRWNNCSGIKARWINFNGKMQQGLTLEQWRLWLKRFAREVPGHLLTPDAHQQAIEIANELQAHDNAENFSVEDAMKAIAVLLARSVTDGRKIYSLGFIADRLLRELDHDDETSILNRPTYLDDSEYEPAHAFAHEARAALETFDWFHMCPERLLSTAEIEYLAAMMRQYGKAKVVDAINKATREKRTPGEGRSVWSWWYFEDDIRGRKKSAPKLVA